MKLELRIPLTTVSALNEREHQMARAKRVKKERKAVWAVWPRRQKLEPVLVVTLVRVGGREFDDDNLRAALKGVRDQVAAELRVDDGSKLIRWDYEQELDGEPGVLVRIAPVVSPIDAARAARDSGMELGRKLRNDDSE